MFLLESRSNSAVGAIIDRVTPHCSFCALDEKKGAFRPRMSSGNQPARPIAHAYSYVSVSPRYRSALFSRCTSVTLAP